MSNNFLQMQKVADRALARLHAEAVLAHNVHRDYEAEFAGKQGSKVIIRKPAVFEAKKFDRATGIVIQDATEGETDVTLDTLFDVSFAVTDEDMSLTIEAFEERLLAPAMLAIVQGIDSLVGGLAADVTASVTGDVTDPKILAAAAATLTGKNVPLADRKAIVGADLYGSYITKPPFDKADSAASDSALREALLGKAYGFDTYQTNQVIGAVEAASGGLAFHRSAFALVTRTLELPKGVTGAVANHDGFGVRVTYGWDQSKKQTVVSVDLLAGVKTLDAERAVVIPAAV